MSVREGGVIYVSMSQCGLLGLQELLKYGKRPESVVTLPVGKGLQASGYADIGAFSLKQGLTILRVENINEWAGYFAALKPAAIIVNGWSQLIRPELLMVPRHGIVGTHPALLPRNRGRAAIPWHFINEESVGGMTLFWMDEGADSGPIIEQESFEIEPHDDARSYYDKSSAIAARLLVKHYDGIAVGTAPRIPQKHADATYLLKRRPQDSLLDFTKPARALHNLARGLCGVYPAAFFRYHGAEYTVERAEVGVLGYYSGQCGQIAAANSEWLSVLASDRVVNLAGIRNRREVLVDPHSFKEGEVLNE